MNEEENVKMQEVVNAEINSFTEQFASILDEPEYHRILTMIPLLVKTGYMSGFIEGIHKCLK